LGGGINMENMAGGKYVIVNVENGAIRLDGRKWGTLWFKKEDLTETMTEEELDKKIKQRLPVMFDPKNILT